MPLERRNTIATVPSAVTIPKKPRHHHSASFSTTGTASSTTITTPSSTSYTSIKEIIAASAISSPTLAGGSGEIAIRNRLVKQAAWAYLQPVSSSSDSTVDHFCGRVVDVVLKCFSMIRSAVRALISAFDCLWF